MTHPWKRACVLVLAASLAACGEPPPQVLGTLEWDRITLPAPVAERIVRIDVREGEVVAAGAPLLQLELTRSAAQAAEARASLARLRPLAARQLVAKSDLDRAVAAAGSADGQVRAAQAVLNELLHGTRPERIAQGEAALAAAQAQATVQAASLGKLDVRAPRAGRVDSLPYRLGDQAPVGAPLAILLVGEAPYARVYVPEPLRAGVKPGQAARVFVDGREGSIAGHVRMVRSEPSFTPYYALSGDDAARLSYLAEVVLDAPIDLPAGVPVRVEFVEATGGR